jgi:hypothetical protein
MTQTLLESLISTRNAKGHGTPVQLEVVVFFGESELKILSGGVDPSLGQD